MIDPVLVPFDDRPGTVVLAWPVTATELRWWCGLTATPDRDQLARWHADPDVEPYLLVEGDEPVGYGELWREPGEVELARLIVAPAHRRRGAGARLVTGLVQLAGATDVFLRVQPDNEPALRLYRSLGWMRVDPVEEAEYNAGQPMTYQWLRAPS